MQGSSIPSQYVLLLVDLAVERGCSIDSICCGTQLTLPSLSQLGARVDTGEVDRLTMNVLAHTSDPSNRIGAGTATQSQRSRGDRASVSYLLKPG
jgi:hypothetical protein